MLYAVQVAELWTVMILDRQEGSRWDTHGVRPSGSGRWRGQQVHE